MCAAKNSTSVVMPSQIAPLVATRQAVAMSTPAEKDGTSPTCFIPRLRNRFPMELHRTVTTMSAVVRRANESVLIDRHACGPGWARSPA